MNQKIYIDLAPEIQRELPGSLRDLFAAEQIEIPPGVELTEGPLPAAEQGVPEKDWGFVIQIAVDPETILALGGAVSMIILALSQLIKIATRAPKVVWVDEVIDVPGPDGGTEQILAKRPVVVEPGPELKAELEGKLQKGKNLSVRFKLEK